MTDTRPSTHRARRWVTAALALVLVAALGACGGDDNGGDSGSTGASDVKADTTMDVTSFAYKDVTVPAGGTLAIKNTSGAAHTFSPDNEGDFKEVDFSDGETATVTAPSKPGEYKFHCDIHPNMTGTMTVQ
jgi:plastocyanin